jgi:diguanylate cyclase (GGDEF)-like protein
MVKILVIEDDPSVQSLVVKLLKAEGFDVVSGSDGRVGIQLVLACIPDLILCDIMMPELNGYEVLEHLRQNPETARIPFIFLSAKADRSDQRQGMDLGADDYLIKPFKRTELLSAISARLEKQTTITQPYIDEMKRAAETLNQMAYRDPLTNLPNRILLHHSLQEAIKQAERSHQPISVFCLNLDQFQTINTNLGYLSGDTLLQKVAERLSRGLGKEATVARLGGDEFSLLLPNLANREELANLAQFLSKLLAEPYDINGHYTQIQSSIGIAIYPEHGNTADRLLHQADIAMRYAKTQGIGTYQFYHHDLDKRALERQTFQESLKGSLDSHQLVLYYQPQINLVTGRITGAEALLRWQHPELGSVPPDKFIPVAEETGFIIPIGQWILQTACQQACSWQHPSRSPVRVFVNLSARQLKQQNLIETIDGVLKQTGLNPDALVLELTETSVMEAVDTTIPILQRLRTMGIHISIDDFGTGYSSLNYLKRFPIDTLKIDKSFVRDITTDANDAAIVKAIIAMAQSLQLKVVAEGVETNEQLTFLRQMGCNAMQGFLFSRAVPAAEFEKMLEEDKRL